MDDEVDGDLAGDRVVVAHGVGAQQREVDLAEVEDAVLDDRQPRLGLTRGREHHAEVLVTDPGALEVGEPGATEHDPAQPGRELLDADDLGAVDAHRDLGQGGHRDLFDRRLVGRRVRQA